MVVAKYGNNKNRNNSAIWVAFALHFRWLSLCNLANRKYRIAFEVFKAGILEYWKKELSIIFSMVPPCVFCLLLCLSYTNKNTQNSSPASQEDYITKEEYSMVSIYAAPTIIPIWLFSAAFGLSHKRPYFVSMHWTFDDYQNAICQIGNMELPLKYLGKVFYNSQFDSPLWLHLTNNITCWHTVDFVGKALCFLSGNTLPWENALEITFE